MFWAFQAWGFPLLFLCAGRNFFFFHSISQILKTVCPQVTLLQKSFFNTKYSQELLWGTIPVALFCGVMFYSRRDPRSPVACTELRLTQHQPLLSLEGFGTFVTSTATAGTQRQHYKLQFLTRKPRESVPTPTTFQCNHRPSSPLHKHLCSLLWGENPKSTPKSWKNRLYLTLRKNPLPKWAPSINANYHPVLMLNKTETQQPELSPTCSPWELQPNTQNAAVVQFSLMCCQILPSSATSLTPRDLATAHRKTLSSSSCAVWEWWDNH